MKSPTNYGSENEETRFIRRVAAPDRPSNKRRQKKRLAIAGATLGLLAASAGVGYATMKASNSTSEVKTAKLESAMANEAFISKLGDAFHPDFDRIDENHDGELTENEIIADLTQKEMVDVDKVKASDLPADIKKNVVALLEGKLQSDSDCAKQALDQRVVPVTRADHEIFYYLLDVFCPRVTIAVTPPDQEEEGDVVSEESQQTVEIPTPGGGTTEVVIVGEPVEGKQTIAIPDGEGGYSTTEVRSIETPTGEQKILIPNAEGDITPVVVPAVPEEVTTAATEDTQVVDVVTPSGETEQVIIEGEPEHGQQTVEIPDNEGGYIETQAKVEETETGEQQLVVETADGDVIEVPVPEPIEEHVPGENGGYIEEEPVQQVVAVTTPEGEPETVTILGEPEHGEVKVEIVDEHGETKVEEVTAIETASGETKVEIPDNQGGEIPVVLPEVPEEVKVEAEVTGEQPQVVDVVTPSGEVEQVIPLGEPEHGEQKVEIIDESGQTTTTEVHVQETATGEEKFEIPTSEGYVAVDVPAPVEEEHFQTGGELIEEEPVQQVVAVTTPEGEPETVTILGEPEHGEVKVEIVDEHGETKVEEVTAIETASGETKVEIPDNQGGEIPVVLPEVPEEVKVEAEVTGEQPQVVDVVTPSGEVEQVIPLGEPEHGEQKVEIIDESGQTTTTEVHVQETATGEEKFEIPTSEGYVAVDVPAPVEEEHFQTGGELIEEEPVQQVVAVTTPEGEPETVTILGEPEHGEVKVEIVDEHGETKVEEVTAIETASGETKVEIPDNQGGEIPVVLPEVPEEVKVEAEVTGEQPQVVDVVTPSGEVEQVIPLGEPEHGEQKVEIIDESGQTTTTEVHVEETATGEEKFEIPTSEGYVAVDVPAPVEEEHFQTGGELIEEEPVQQVVAVTTPEGEPETVTILGEPEHGEVKVEIVDEHGETKVEEVTAIETASGETKVEIPDNQGGEIPVVLPEVPEEVKVEAEVTGEQPQVVDVVTPSGEVEQVIPLGEPEHGEQKVEIIDESGQTTTTEVHVQETATGEEKFEIPTSEGYVAVDVPAPVEEEHFQTGGELIEEEPVQQVVAVTTPEGEPETVTILGEPEHGEVKVEIVDEHGETKVEEVTAIETASGETKVEIPDNQGGEIPVVLPEVPEEVKVEAEVTGEQPQVVDVVTPSGEVEQVIPLGEPEHGEQKVEIIDESGQTTTTEVHVEETATGEEKFEIPTSEGYVAVDVPAPVEEEHFQTGGELIEEEPVQQVVAVTTPEGEPETVTILGEPEHGEVKVEIVDEHGETKVEEVTAIETASGETKVEIPDNQGGEIPVVLPEVPEEVKVEAEVTGEQPQVVDVVTPSGEVEQVIPLGEPEHGEQKVEIIDESGQTTTTEVHVQETATGEEKFEIPTSEGYVAVDVPAPVEEEHFQTGGELIEEEPVQQVVAVTTPEGEPETVTILGEPEHGEVKVEIVDEHGETKVEEVTAIETASGETKVEIPDNQGGEIPVVLPEVPEEVKVEAEVTGEQPQVVDVVTPSGEVEQVIPLGEPEHGEQKVEIIDESGQTTTTEVHVQETATGEEKFEIPTSEGYVAVDVPAPVEEEHFQTGGELIEEEPVQQVVAVTTPEGEPETVTILGEPEHGEVKVEIVDEHGETKVEEVTAIETASGETKVEIPDNQGGEIPVVLPEVPEEVKVEAEVTGEQPQVVDVVTPSGEVEQVIPLGEPEHGEQKVEIIDESGQTTTTEVHVEETATGEEKFEIPTSEGYVAVDVPAPVEEEHFQTGGELIEEEPVQQVVAVTTPEGEPETVTILGEPEHGEVKVEIVDEHGETKVEEVTAIETASGETKVEIPDNQGGEIPVVLPEVPEEVKVEAEVTGEQPQVVDVVTPSGEVEQVIPLGEPEHGEQKVEIIDESGQTTTTEVHVQETATGEEKFEIPTSEGYVAVDVPAPVEEEHFQTGGELIEEEPVQQVVAVTTPEGEPETVTILGEPEHGEVKVEIVDEHGETKVEEVTAIETASGETKVEIPDNQGGEIPVVLPEVPEEVKVEAEVTGEQPQVVDVVTPSGEVEQVIPLGEPEHGEQKVEIIDESGQTTTTEVHVQETATGEEKFEIPTSEGYVAVDVPAPVEEVPAVSGNLMTKVEFRDWIAKNYEDKLAQLKKEEEKLEDEARVNAGRVKSLEDCIEQAANKFGYYGVYEQPPHYQNAVSWVENECWANQWEPESPPEHPMLRR